jgi:hypothetical protein
VAVSDAEWAWLAGLFEGEGTIVLQQLENRGSRATVVAVSMTDRDVIERLDRLVPSPNGVVVRPRARPHWNDQYVWRLCAGSDVRAFLTGILPWLGKRRSARAEQALERIAQMPGLGAYNRRKNRCKRGHVFDETNTYRHGPAGRWRACRTCKNAWARNKRAS